MSEFGKAIAEAYAVEGAAIDLGRGVHEGALSPDAVVQVPLRMMNRHGLIAGATGTGTGKTITLQTIAEQLSAASDFYHVEAAAEASPLFAKYGTRTEAESAKERLAGRLDEAELAQTDARSPTRGRSGPAEEARRLSKRRRKEAATATTGGTDMLGDFLRSREGKALGRKVARGVFGLLRKRR